MQEATERTQRDVDIIRQSSLKAAIELMVGFKDQINITDGTEVITTTLQVADQFYSWVTSQEEETDHEPPKPKPKPPKRQPAHEYDTSKGNGNGNRLSKKQYGYICSLYHRLGEEPDHDTIQWISSKDASALIDDLLYQVGVHKGNGNRPGIGGLFK